MKIAATTETGSVYHIDLDSRLWNKNDHGPRQSIWLMKTLPADPQPRNWQEAFALLETQPEVDTPVVGQRLYISGKETYHLSTPIVSIEEED